MSAASYERSLSNRQGLITVQTTPPLANLMQGNAALRVKDSKCKCEGLMREVSPLLLPRRTVLTDGM
jgi:hypothetical protein